MGGCVRLDDEKWLCPQVRGLLERVEAPLEKIRALNKLVLDTEEARAIFARQGALVQAMTEFEEEHAKTWVSKVSKVRMRRDRGALMPCMMRFRSGGMRNDVATAPMPPMACAQPLC